MKSDSCRTALQRNRSPLAGYGDVAKVVSRGKLRLFPSGSGFMTPGVRQQPAIPAEKSTHSIMQRRRREEAGEFMVIP